MLCERSWRASRCKLFGVEGLQAKLHGNFVSAAEVGLVDAVQNSVNRDARILVLFGPLGDRFSLAAQASFNLIGGHGVVSFRVNLL